MQTILKLHGQKDKIEICVEMELHTHILSLRKESGSIVILDLPASQIDSNLKKPVLYHAIMLKSWVDTNR
ncbi:hypothetical protein [Helicobacter bilis]|uniref:hypothetical protein n=1 Tax=Helicobacter bilis TaxID=37372 RepID=UPI0026EFF7B9|nr:hypothetical protein [Helicobacter bilis]MCI7410805.1 hypothetical protein [Helicobacter bilis]MDD7296244.1 hypothetical protein [Helicobacter bilis]MDY4399204.1 hypothetical protein [Helicobacter bilis]